MGNLSLLIVEPDGDARMRIKHALSEFKDLGTPEFTIDLDESVRKISLGASYDIVFISQRFDKDAVHSFVGKCRDTRSGQDSTYIMVLNSRENSVSYLGLEYAIGVDGFLLEPYSPERLKEIVELSLSLKGERAETREKAALTVTVSEIIDIINLIAFLKSCDFEVSRSMKRLKELCVPLLHLGGDSTKVYFDVMTESFTEAPFPAHLQGGDKYEGFSKRVRKRMEQKLMRELLELKQTGFKPSVSPGEKPEEDEVLAEDGTRPGLLRLVVKRA